MAQLIIDIPDAYVTRVVDAFAATFDWTPATGLTKTQFAKARVAKYIKDIFQSYESTLAGQTAIQSSITDTSQANIT